MTIEYTLRYGEHYEANVLQWKKEHPRRYFLNRYRYYIGGGAAGVAGVLMSVSPVLAVLAFGGVIGAIALDGFTRVMNSPNNKRAYTAYVQEQPKVQLELAADGFTMIVSERRIYLQWSRILEIMKGESVWVLCLEEHARVIIPLRVLDDATKKFIEEAVKMSAMTQTVSTRIQ